jgi:hypothetical protein
MKSLHDAFENEDNKEQEHNAQQDPKRSAKMQLVHGAVFSVTPNQSPQKKEGKGGSKNPVTGGDGVGHYVN